MFIFSVLDWKYLFEDILSKISKLSEQVQNLVLRLIQKNGIWRLCSLFLSSTGNTLSGQIWSKIQSFMFKVKFGIKPKSNYAEIVGDTHFFLKRLERPFLCKEIQIVHLK